MSTETRSWWRQTLFIKDSGSPLISTLTPETRCEHDRNSCQERSFHNPWMVCIVFMAFFYFCLFVLMLIFQLFTQIVWSGVFVISANKSVLSLAFPLAIWFGEKYIKLTGIGKRKGFPPTPVMTLLCDAAVKRWNWKCHRLLLGCNGFSCCF